MYGSELWSGLPTPAVRVLIGEAVAAVQAQAILQLAMTSLALFTATATSVSVFHFSRKS